MDNLNPTGTAVPPRIPPAYYPDPPPPGDSPEERAPIPNAIAAIEAILRQPRRVMFHLGQPGAGRLIAAMLLVAVASPWSTAWWSAVSPPAPSSGPRQSRLPAACCSPSHLPAEPLHLRLPERIASRLTQICGLVVGLVMLMTLLLIGFAPVAWLFSQSTASACLDGRPAPAVLVALPRRSGCGSCRPVSR